MTANYECPRCGYETRQRTDMKRHFDRKHICLPKLSDLTLTNDIINQVMLHQYKKTSPSTGYPDRVSTIYQTINNYNILNNVIVKMDTIDKVNHLIQYLGGNDNESSVKLLGFEQTMEKYFDRKTELLREGKSNSLTLTDDDFLECLNQATKINHDPCNFNIIYNRESNEISIYHDETWETYLENRGIQRIVGFLSSYLFNDYELYLLRKIHDPQCYLESTMTNYLRTLYTFLNAFNLEPYVNRCTDRFITGSRLCDTDDYKIEKYAKKIYHEQKDSLKDKEKREIKNSVLKIIKNNTNTNIRELNIAIMDLLHINKTFRENIFTKSLITTKPILEITNS